MKTLLTKLIFLFSIFSVFVYLNIRFASAQNSAENRVITRFIAKQARSEDAEEYKNARKIIRADLNRDGKTDAIVLYTLEGFDGSNRYAQYLAAFTQTRRGTLRFAAGVPIGGKNNRGVELKSVGNGKINLITLKYLPSDGSCCPSKKGFARVVLAKNKLIEIKL